MTQLRRVAGWCKRKLIGLFRPAKGKIGTETVVVVTRGKETFRVRPDDYDDFKFKTGDMLTIERSSPNEEVVQTPDSNLHLRKSNREAIRIPATYVGVDYRGYVLPDHLMVLTGAGAVTWDVIGEKHISNYVKFMDFDRDMSLLEIGCGIGRDALQLSEVFGYRGNFVGIDVTRDSIVWCQKNISTAHPNFKFYHFDAQHELYNPLGTKTSMDFSLPVPDQSIDRVSLGSVFTHLFEDEIVHYMKEIRRVLKKDGLAYATFFLYSDEIIAAARKHNLTPNNLRFEYAYGDGCYINDARYPTGAVAFTDAAMTRMILNSGLKLAKPYLNGWWSGLYESAEDGQEVAILTPA